MRLATAMWAAGGVQATSPGCLVMLPQRNTLIKPGHLLDGRLRDHCSCQVTAAQLCRAACSFIQRVFVFLHCTMLQSQSLQASPCVMTVGELITELGIALACVKGLRASDMGMPQIAQCCSEQANATAWDVAVSAWYLAHPRQSWLSRADRMWATGTCGWQSHEVS